MESTLNQGKMWRFTSFEAMMKENDSLWRCAGHALRVHKGLHSLWLTASLLFSLQGLAAERLDEFADIRIGLAAAGLPLVEVTGSEVPGLYEVKLTDGTVLLTDRTGTYFVVGDVYQRINQRIVNLSDLRRNEDRRALLANLDESEMVVFEPASKDRKAEITVFTDIDCGFCRKLHQEVPELNRLGIAVRYLAYPRAGIGSESFNKIVSAWCSNDQKRALTLAKAGETIESLTCDNPVAKHFDLGGRMGVTGTPAIVLESGRLVPGYLPAERLAAELGLSVDS